MAKGGVIPALQVIRAIAALLVVYHHAFRSAIANLPLTLPHSQLVWQPEKWAVGIGFFGIDLFFVLSGFLMVYISRRYYDGDHPVLRFLLERFVRIWPLYMVFTVVALGIEAERVHFHIDGLFDFRFTRLLSILFIPSFNEIGDLQPVLGVGWTLNYEAFFYLAFACTFFVNERKSLAMLIVILGAAYSVASCFPLYAAGIFYSDTIILEFCSGAFIAHIISTNIKMRFGWAWIIAGIIILSLFNNGFTSVILPRFISGGLPASLIVIGGLTLKSNTSYPLVFIKIGEASYSIYLSHSLIVGILTERIMSLSTYGLLRQFSVAIAGSLSAIFCVIVGYAIHKIVELRLLYHGRRFVFRVLSKLDANNTRRASVTRL